MRISALLFLVLVVFSASVIGKDYEITQRPDWVTEMDYPESASVEAQNYPISVLLHEKQYQLSGEQQRFHRSVYAINSLQGLSQFTNLNIDFDPSYEQVQIHAIDVFGASYSTSQINDRVIKTFNLENLLEENIYTGQKRINILLENLKVGDHVVVEYTVLGRNPVFEGYFFQELPLQFSTFIQKLHYRISGAISFQDKIHGNVPESLESATHLNGKMWTVENIEPYVAEENVPDDHTAVPWTSDNRV